MKNRKRRKTIGILGGMGPEATARFFELLILNTAARRDQDHVPVVIWNDPRIPDRTEAILKKGVSPVPLLIEGARTLARAGADLIVMPCLTAHFFHRQISDRMRIPFLNLLEEALAHVRKTQPGLKAIGLLATSGTVRSGLVDRVFARSGIKVVVPGESEQNNVMEALYGPQGIKAGCTAGRSRRLILAVARSLIRKGAGAIMAGCSEIPLVLGEEDLSVPLVEPMAIGAIACIKKAGYPVRKACRRRKPPLAPEPRGTSPVGSPRRRSR